LKRILLTDHRRQQERDAERAERSRQAQSALGDFLKALLVWIWYMTITFRDDWRPMQAVMPAGAPSAVALMRSGYYSLYAPDPRIAAWQSSSQQNRTSHGPNPERASDSFKDYVKKLEAAAGAPIGCVAATNFGTVGGRFHAHLLIAGVAHLSIDEWWRIAFSRFGRTTIDEYDPSRGGTYYVAKNALAENGELWFGGQLLADLPKNASGSPVGRVVVARSADVPSVLFHMTLGRRRQR
jgi:hypothetical protein